MRDREVAASIWRPTDNMWWDGPDDPNAGLYGLLRGRLSYGTVRLEPGDGSIRVSQIADYWREA